MKTYARYIHTADLVAKVIGNEWYEVTAEYIKRYPSGYRTVVVINGLTVKADHCEIVQVF